MFPVTAAEFAAAGTAEIMENQYIAHWGFPESVMSDHGLKFCSKLGVALRKLLVIPILVKSPYHPNGNGAVERVNLTTAQMLSLAVKRRQND